MRQIIGDPVVASVVIAPTVFLSTSFHVSLQYVCGIDNLVRQMIGDPVVASVVIAPTVSSSTFFHVRRQYV